MKCPSAHWIGLDQLLHFFSQLFLKKRKNLIKSLDGALTDLQGDKRVSTFTFHR